MSDRTYYALEMMHLDARCRRNGLGSRDPDDAPRQAMDFTSGPFSQEHAPVADVRDLAGTCNALMFAHKPLHHRAA